MSNNQSYKIGDKVIVNDIATAPEGSWVVRDTMQFLRAQAGHSIISLTPIEGGILPVSKLPEKFTLVFAGSLQAEKSSACADAMNSL